MVATEWEGSAVQCLQFCFDGLCGFCEGTFLAATDVPAQLHTSSGERHRLGVFALLSVACMGCLGSCLVIRGGFAGFCDLQAS